MYPATLENSERMVNLLYNIQEAILIVQYGIAKPSDDTWDDWAWYQSGSWPVRHLKLGVLDFWQLHEYTGWLIDTKLSPNKDKKRLLANLCEVVLWSAVDLRHYNSASFEFIITKLLERGLTLDANHSPGFVHGQCRKLECRVRHEFVCLELHYTMTYTNVRGNTGYTLENEEMRFNWRGPETLLRFGADPDIYLSTDKEQRGVVLGPTGDVLYEGSSRSHGRSRNWKFFLHPERSTVSLTDFIKFHEPPNMDEFAKVDSTEVGEEDRLPGSNRTPS
jgi:hypothetical protein